MADQSFSSFADLKEFKSKLRHQEAQEAQAKADAIEVKAGSEHLNPIKRKAQEAQAALAQEAQAQAAPARSERASARPAVTARAPEAPREPRREPRREARSDGRGKMRGKHQGKRAEANLTGRAKDEAESKRLNKALGRLQRKANELNTHHEKDVAQAKDKAKAKARAQAAAKKQGPAQQEQAGAQPQRAAGAQGKARPQVNGRKSGKQGPTAPKLQGKYFDLESLKLVRAAQDEVKYQARREMYRRLGSLDELIQAEVARLYLEQPEPKRSVQELLPQALSAEAMSSRTDTV